MKRTFALCLTALCLFFAACAPAQENAAATTITLTRTAYDMPQKQPVWVTLYYPADDASRVLAFSQQLMQNDSLYDDIMDVLLSGTPEGYKSCFPSDVTCRAMQLIQNVLYIDLSWQFRQLDAAGFYTCLSVLASTFTDLPEVDFVNVTVEGEQLRAPQTREPVLLLSSYSGTIGDFLTHHNDVLRSGIPRLSTCYAMLYETDGTGRYLLPVASFVTVYNGDYSSAFLRALLAKEETLFPGGFSLSGEPTLEKNTLSVSLVCPRGWSAPEDWPGPAALLCTLSSLYSSVTALKLTVTSPDGESVFSARESAADAYARIRSRIDVITPDSSGTRLVHTAMLVSRMPGKSDLKRFVEAYLVTVEPRFKETDSVVNDVILMGDTVWIDLGRRYYDAYGTSMSPAGEYAVVYSLIVSVCSYCGASRAMMLEDHQARSTFAGSIALDQPLMTLPQAHLDQLP